MCYNKPKQINHRLKGEFYQMSDNSQPTALIEASNIHKEFRTPDGKTTTKALKGVSLSVQPNELVAIVGSSGSGKSTLLYCLSGLQKSTDGSVDLLGEKLRHTEESANLTKDQREGVGFVFQSYQLLTFLTVQENIVLPSKYTGNLKQAQEKLPALLERLDLSDKIDSKVSELSGGQQQRVAIARALINEPSIIFADEPTGALDTKNAKEVISILSSIPNENRSVLMVTHDLEMASHASRVLILSDGQIATELGRSNPSEILSAMNAAKNNHSQEG